MGERHVRDSALTLIKNAVDQIERVPLKDAQIHRAVDMLRANPSDAELLAVAEWLSCAMAHLCNFRRQGLVNAYQSKLLRIRRTCQGLS